MQPELDDSEFVTECFRKLDLIEWLLSSHSSKPGRVSNLIYQFHRNGRNAGDMVWIDEFVDICVYHSFQHVDDVLKLKNTPNMLDDRFLFLLQELSSLRNSFTPKKITAARSLQRCSLLLQVFWVYFIKFQKHSEASEFLRLIWNSVPDSFLSSDEIATAFKEGTNSTELSDIFNFYSEAVGGLHLDVVPRKLKHYSRTVIRRRLSQNGHWLPDGIKEIGLPKKLQSYLNLE
ncbi:hypothetical protein AVEN_256323-1 [Araneus ventricosus]|uniref:SOCS box domain-containing protein n=1 Tax=Araneus ventricosus TaxID=182803 RepID=A0A4Y2RT57_ARAVE|nr:hypothetical protein AVEN_256323-1 [Araneus ventricosus]